MQVKKANKITEYILNCKKKARRKNIVRKNEGYIN